jgi:hypothetical protein
MERRFYESDTTSTESTTLGAIRSLQTPRRKPLKT